MSILLLNPKFVGPGEALFFREFLKNLMGRRCYTVLVDLVDHYRGLSVLYKLLNLEFSVGVEVRRRGLAAI